MEFKNVHEYLTIVKNIIKKEESTGMVKIFKKKPIDVLPLFPVFLANTVELGGALFDLSAEECNEIHSLNYEIQEFNKAVKQKFLEAPEIKWEEQIRYVLEVEPIRILFDDISEAFEEIEQRQWYQKYSKKIEKQNKK